MTRCTQDTVLELDALRSRVSELLGKTVTIAGPLRDAHPWCIDCCPSLGAILALAGDIPAVRVTLNPWSCPSRAGGGADCPLPPDGKRITVTGRLDRVIHGQAGDLVLHDTKLCAE